MRIASSLLVICSLGAPASAAPLTLVKGGRPGAAIVVPAGAKASLKQAAEDLQHYVRAISGVTLPVHADGKAVEGTGLYIGRCEPTTAPDLPPETLDPETYAIRVRNGDVFFTGRWPTPACFAVYSFIEDVLGVRWFAPGKLWEHVPAGKTGELVVDVRDVVKVPGTAPRVWSGHAWFDNWKRWNLRNKTVMGEVVTRRQFQNFVHRVITPAKYAKEHPEYFPLVNGKRYIPGKGDRHWRPCESNPDVQRIVVEYARKWFDSHPNMDSFSVGMDDISHLCACPDCRAMDPRPDSYEKREFSDRHYKFVNAIAREIAKTHPNRYVGTLIYNIARQLPETVDRLEDNVFGFITETSALWWQEGRKEADQKLSREWAKRCRHLSRYDYFGMGTFTPRVYPHAMAEQIKFDKSLGFEGMYTEVYTFLPHTAPMIWAFAKLQWDHTLDIDALLGEFYAKMYGSGAPAMKAYFDLLEREWNTPRPGRNNWVHRRIVCQALAMSPEGVDAGLELLSQARAATSDPKARTRIEIHRAALQYAGYAVKAYGLSQRIGRLAVTDEKSARQALALVDKLSAMAIERERFWAACHERDDLLGETIRGLGDKMGYLQTGKVARLEQGSFEGVAKALAWYSEHGPEKLGAVVKRLGSLGAGSVADMLRAWLWVQEHKPANLLANGGFEQLGPNAAKPEKDWRTEGAPKGWSFWSSNPETRSVLAGDKGRNGSVAASIAGARSACFLQRRNAKPGETYLCVCWAKADPSTVNAGAQLGIRFRDVKGGWHKRRDLEPTVSSVEGRAGWQPLVVFITVPEGAGSLMVMPGVRGQAAGATALFDDVALYKVPACKADAPTPGVGSR